MSFTPEVYEQIREGAQRSAAVVVPLVYGMVKPETVVDVGGGEGWWAYEFAGRGCRVLLIDSEVEEERRSIVNSGGTAGEVLFVSRDLSQGWADLQYQADLAVCLEVGEHLPETSAAALVQSLCACAPVVLFSAAIPNQGGHGHVNEQWPDYWAKLFQSHDFFVLDGIRWLIWDDERVEPWYRQNLFWAVAAGHPLLQRTGPRDWMTPKRVVHPAIYEWRVAERDRLNAVLYKPEDGDGTVWNG